MGEFYEQAAKKLNDGYFRDAVGYLEAAEDEIDTPTLFDLMGVAE